MEEAIRQIRDVIAYYSGYLDTLGLPEQEAEALEAAEKIDLLKASVNILKDFTDDALGQEAD